jgi:Skp family chaperone for outer membrane proteins
MRTLVKHTLLLLFTAAALNTAAQDDDMPAIPEERMQEIKAQKTAVLTQRLDLSPAEAEKFWPVYNQFDKELDANRKEMRAEHKAAKKDTDLTEAEASAAIDKEMAGRQKELDIRKKYAAEFKKTIGAVKTLKLGKAERDFRKELIKRFRDRMEDRREGGGGRRPGGKP